MDKINQEGLLPGNKKLGYVYLDPCSSESMYPTYALHFIQPPMCSGEISLSFEIVIQTTIGMNGLCFQCSLILIHSFSSSLCMFPHLSFFFSFSLMQLNSLHSQLTSCIVCLCMWVCVCVSIYMSVKKTFLANCWIKLYYIVIIVSHFKRQIECIDCKPGFDLGP